MSRRKYGIDKFFTKLSHTATSGVVGESQYDVKGEGNLRVVSTFASSGTLTIQGRIEGSDTWDALGTLASGGDSDSFDISTYDFVRFNFTVAAGSSGEIAASGFFKGSGSGGGGASNSFTIIQPDAGTSPQADSATDTLSFTSSDSSITITGNETTDTIDLVVAGGGSGDVTGPSSSQDNALVRFDGTTGKIIQDYTSDGPKVTDAGVATFPYTAGGVTNNERIGASSTITLGSYCSLFGDTTQTYGSFSTVFGRNARTIAGGGNSTGSAFGAVSVATGGGQAFGYASNAGPSSISFGGFANTFNISFSIAIGRSATCNANNQLVIGGPTSYRINEGYLGAGVTSATAYDFELRGTCGSGTNNSPGNFYIKPGAGTGTGTGGHLIVQTAAAGASGSALNTYTTQLEVTDDGNIIMPNLPTSSAGLPTGALWNNSGVINIV